MNNQHNESNFSDNAEQQSHHQKTLFEKMEDLFRSNPQHAAHVFQQMRSQVTQMMQMQLAECCQNLKNKLSHSSISQEQARLFSPSEIKLSLYSFWKEDDLMYALGIWDKQNFTRFQTIRHRIVSEEIARNKSTHPNLSAVALLLDTETIFSYAFQCGIYFPHNEAFKKNIKQLSNALYLYNLSLLNLYGKHYDFEDGTPPCLDWSQNKKADETEQIVLYNTIMTLNTYTTERDTIIRMLIERLVENKVARAVQNLQEQSFDLIADNPKQALHIYLACDHIKSLLKFQEPLEPLHQQFVFYHTIKEMKNLLESQDDEASPMVLEWYNSCTHSCLEKMPDEIKVSKLTIVSHHSNSNKTQRQSTKKRERND